MSVLSWIGAIFIGLVLLGFIDWEGLWARRKRPYPKLKNPAVLAHGGGIKRVR